MEFQVYSAGISAHFRVTEEGKLLLLHLGAGECPDIPEKQLKWHNPGEIHVSGGNQDDHHGAKHSGSSGIFTLHYVSHTLTRNADGQKLEVTLADGQLRSVLHWQFYDGIPAVRSWTVVENVSQAPVGLEYVASFSLMGLEAGTPDEDLRVLIPHNAWLREVNWKEYTLHDLGLHRAQSFSTKRIAVSNTGTWSTKEYLPMGAVQRRDSMLMWQIESSGSWHWEISDLASALYLRLSGPTERENQWHKELQPGEQFESVKAAVVLGADFNASIAAMTQYRRRIFRPVAADQGKPVIFNDYMNCLFADPTTEKELPVIDRAAAAGAEYYVMDAGWYADGTWWETVGEWMPCAWRFPDGGLKRVFDYIHNKGMIPGIWLEIETMGIHCPILDQFEDGCFFMRHGRRVVDHGRYQLNFANEKVRSFASGVIDRLVAEYGVGYIKMDYNIEAGAGTELEADSFGDGLLKHRRAYLAWIDEVREKYPKLVIENCSSGGMRLDYAMLERHPIQSLTDQEDWREMTHVSQAAATAALPEQSAIWSYPVAKDGLNAVAVNMVNAMGLRMHLSGQIMDLNAEQFALVQAGVACYKATRDEISASTAFYPAGLPNYDDALFCVGYRSPRKTYLAAWRMETQESTLKLALDGRNARIVYPADGSCTVRGNENSLEITLNAQNTAVFLEI